ncbi:MAG: hypothetical protein K0S74_885 [Chlamydiales bacterium]|nr:hypothetical protein [Chlamydiales bacterium]
MTGTKLHYSIQTSTVYGSVTAAVLNYQSWNHVAVTYNGSTYIAYINGIQIDSVSASGSSSATVDYIGCVDNNYGGQISEVRVWNTARTPAQIRSSMLSRLQANESNLLAYFLFDEGTGTNLYDLTGNGYNGTLNNTPVWQRSAPVFSAQNRGLYFDGTNDCVKLPTLPLNTFSSNSITLETWVNPYDLTTYANGPIVDLGNGAASDNICLRFNSNTKRISLLSYGGATSSTLNGVATVSENQWSHVAATISSTGTACIYINGKLDATGTITAPTNVSRTTSYIGTSSITNTFFRGVFKDLRIWKVALTQQQIQTYMHKIPPKENWNIVAEYKMAEAAGQSVCDSSGNGYHATLGATNSVATDDPQYIVSLPRNRIHDSITSNKYTVLSLCTYDPAGNTYSTIIKSLPLQGFLYQYDDTQANNCGTQITAANTTLTDASFRLVYYPNMTGASSYDTVYFDYTTKGGSEETSSSRVHINLVPPVSISGTVANQAVNDNATVSLFTGFKLSKVDLSQKWTYTITLDDATHGTLSGTVGTYNSGTGIYTLTNVSASVAEADIRSIVFTPRTNAIPATTTETTTFTVACTDGSVADSITTVVTTSVNDAPILTAANPVMTTITATNTTNIGQTVASILGTSVTDIDFGAVEGIAITAAPITSGAGTWQYSLNGGTTWIAYPAVSTTTALLLRDTDRVRFLPDGTYQASGSFSYYAWDQTSGTAGSTANVTTRGGTTAFSTVGDTATISVTGLHAPWTLTTTAGSTAYVLSNPLVIIDTGVAETDSANTVAGANIVIQVTSGAHPKDTITISSLGTGAGQINVVGNYVKYGSIIIGTYNGASIGGTALRIVLNKNATQASINAIMRRISFYNGDTSATVGNRVVSYTYSDNSGTTHSATKTVSVTTLVSPSAPTSPLLVIPTVTSVYNTLASANQYATSFTQISSYLRSFFRFFR